MADKGGKKGLSCSGMIGAFVFLVGLVLVFRLIGCSPKTTEPSKENTTNSSQVSTTNSSQAKSFVDNIKGVTKTDDNKANDIKSLLDDAGLTGYTSIELNTSDDEFDYYKIVTSQNNFILTTTKDGTVDGLNIEMNFTVPPLIENGKIIHTYSEYIITDSIKSTLRVECQLQVEKLLKSPSSAKFPTISNWSFTKDFDTGYLYVSSYVDADNSFGASIRSNFTFGFKINENDTYRIVYCVFDDTVILDRR